MRLEMETDPPKADRETRDHAWQEVETRKAKKKKSENKKKEKKVDNRSYDLDECVLAH